MTTPTPPASGQEPVPPLSPVAAKDWALYTDWCTATGRDPHGTGWVDLSAFLADLPATDAVQQRRMRHLRPLLDLGAGGLPRPTAPLRSRLGPAWASYPDALAALRHEWWPDGVAARRDALIIVLVARGFTRHRLRQLRPHAVQVFPDYLVDGLELPMHRDPALCPRCALNRWLQILVAYRHRSGHDIEDHLTEARTYNQPHHDCHDPLDDGWRTVPRLIPAIDQHGALTLGPPISTRALTSILARRFTPQKVTSNAAELNENSAAPRTMGERPTREQHDDIGQLYDTISDNADALTQRILWLLADAEESRPN